MVLLVVGIKMFLAEWLKLSLGKYFNFYLLALVLVILTTGSVFDCWQNNVKCDRELG